MLVLASIVLPITMYILQHYWNILRKIFNWIAFLSFLIFGNISSLSILGIIENKTVFMTTIHAVFLNPSFLMTGGYIGIYILYQLLMIRKQGGVISGP
ncbi:transposase [Heyndrickxia vini]|uniref:transposase n=1 Tax=Heyndrickxia vini TaxID=1476025 RepID=UPI001FEBDBCA|nr:transposase [Heyndrickxia vini]